MNEESVNPIHCSIEKEDNFCYSWIITELMIMINLLSDYRLVVITCYYLPDSFGGSRF